MKWFAAGFLLAGPVLWLAAAIVSAADVPLRAGAIVFGGALMAAGITSWAFTNRPRRRHYLY